MSAGLYRKHEWRRESVKRGVANLRTKRRMMLIKQLGGKCQRCGYNRCFAALELHHRDKKTKSFKIDRSAMTRPWEQILEEVKKCDLLCSNCHREEHFGELTEKVLSAAC